MQYDHPLRPSTELCNRYFDNECIGCKLRCDDFFIKPVETIDDIKKLELAMDAKAIKILKEEKCGM